MVNLHVPRRLIHKKDPDSLRLPNCEGRRAGLRQDGAAP
jgi:hypothetical protein